MRIVGGLLFVFVLSLLTLVTYKAVSSSYSFGEAKQNHPEVVKDLPGKLVAVPDPTTPGQLIAWLFDKKDELKAEVIDQRKEGHKDIYYVELSAKSPAGATLKGIAELHYVTIAKKQYLIAVGSINLETSPPKKAEQAKPQQAQKPPE
jgi:hypothetical protein